MCKSTEPWHPNENKLFAYNLTALKMLPLAQIPPATSSIVNITYIQNIPTGTSPNGAGGGHPVVGLILHDSTAVPVIQEGNDLLLETQTSQQALVQLHLDLTRSTVQLRLQTLRI